MDQKAKYFEPNETLASQHEIFGPKIGAPHAFKDLSIFWSRALF